MLQPVPAQELQQLGQVLELGQDAAHLTPHIRRAVRSLPGIGILGVALAVRAHPPR